MNNYQEQLKNAQPTVTITPTPINLDRVGDTFRGMFIGLQTFSKRDPNTGAVSELPVANFYDGVGIRTNMGAQLTRICAMLKPGVSVEVKLTELKRNGKGGSTKIYSVTPLNIPVANVAEMFAGLNMVTAPVGSDRQISAPEEEPNAEVIDQTTEPTTEPTEKDDHAITWQAAFESLGLPTYKAKAFLNTTKGDYETAYKLASQKHA